MSGKFRTLSGGKLEQVIVIQWHEIIQCCTGVENMAIKLDGRTSIEQAILPTLFCTHEHTSLSTHAAANEGCKGV